MNDFDEMFYVFCSPRKNYEDDIIELMDRFDDLFKKKIKKDGMIILD